MPKSWIKLLFSVCPAVFCIAVISSLLALFLQKLIHLLCECPNIRVYELGAFLFTIVSSSSWIWIQSMEALYLDNCAVHKHIGFWCLCIPTECFVVRWILILFGEESCDMDTSFVCLSVCFLGSSNRSITTNICIFHQRSTAYNE